MLLEGQGPASLNEPIAEPVGTDTKTR
jgi:hypothetical protein